MASQPPLSYSERLQTFETYWDESFTAARQLAAIGHVCDRPPLESLEEGSRCLGCSRFIPKAISIAVLEGPMRRKDGYMDSSCSFHEPKCTRLSLRVPILEGHKSDLGNLDFHNMRERWERKIKPNRPAKGPQTQSSSLFSLPTELRLQIYFYILPALDPVTEVTPMHSDSIRMITRRAFEKPGPRNKTKINILLTCKAVHDEALDLFYMNTTFHFTSTRHMYLFLRQIGHTGRQRLKAVDVVCAGREDAIAFALLASCEKLKSITLWMPRPVLLWARPPLWVSDGVACMLALSGLEHVKFGMSGARMYMKDDHADAALVKRELTRPKGTPGGVREVNGLLDV